MTIREVIDEIDEIEPNAYTDEQKARWVLRAEGNVEVNILLMPARHVSSLPDYNRQLLAPAPFDALYAQYLHAMIHYANSEYERYQNDMALYNETFGNYARWFAQNYDPSITINRIPVAWSIALDPGEFFSGPVDDRMLCGVLSPLHISCPENVAGTVHLYSDGEPLLTFDSDIRTEEMLSHNAMGGRHITGNASLHNTGDYRETLRVYGMLYQYGYPDKYGRHP